MFLLNWIRRRRTNRVRKKVREDEERFVALDHLVDMAMIDFAVRLEQPIRMVGEKYVIGDMVFDVAQRAPWDSHRMSQPSDPNVLGHYLVRVFGVEITGGIPGIHIIDIGSLNNMSSDDVARVIGPLVGINFEADTVLAAIRTAEGKNRFL